MTTFCDSAAKAQIRGLIFTKVQRWMVNNADTVMECHTLPAAEWLLEKQIIAVTQKLKPAVPLQLHCYTNDRNEFFTNREVVVPQDRYPRKARVAVKQLPNATVIYHREDIRVALPQPGCPSMIWADYCGHDDIQAAVEHLFNWAAPGNLIGVTFDCQWRRRKGNIPVAVSAACPHGSAEGRAEALNKYILGYFRDRGVHAQEHFSMGYQGGVRTPMFTGFYEIVSVAKRRRTTGGRLCQHRQDSRRLPDWPWQRFATSLFS